MAVTFRRVPIPRAFVTVCVVAVLAGGCSSGSDKGAPSTTRPAPRTTVRPTVTTRPPVTNTTTSTPIPGPLLATLMLKDAPSGYPLEAESTAATGPTGLEKAVQDDALSDEGEARRALKAAGFLRGYQRQWSTVDGVGQNFDYVYQFATPEGAKSYLEHWRSAAIAGATRADPVPFVPVLPGAMGLKANDVRGSSGVVLFSKGPYAVQAVVTGGRGINQSVPASDLAFAQYALLP